MGQAGMVTGGGQKNTGLWKYPDFDALCGWGDLRKPDQLLGGVRDRF
jgi:hypothetical protein